MEKTWDRRPIDTQVVTRNTEFSICECPIEYSCSSCEIVYNEKDMKETANGQPRCPNKHSGQYILALLCDHEIQAWINIIE